MLRNRLLQLAFLLPLSAALAQSVPAGLINIAGARAPVTQEPPSGGDSIGGYPMPSLQDERDFMTSLGYSGFSSIEPNYPTHPGYALNFATEADVHNRGEGDDIWLNLIQNRRTGQAGYLSRLNAWKAFWVSQQNASPKGQRFEHQSWGNEHIYGWGEAALCEQSASSDTVACNLALEKAADVAFIWGPNSTFSAMANHGGMGYGGRHAGRHLRLIVEVRRVFGNVSLNNATGSGTITAQALADTIVDKLISASLTSQNLWNTTYGMYFVDSSTTDAADVGGTGAYAFGIRAFPSKDISFVSESLFLYYNNNKSSSDPTMIARLATVRSRLVSIANFIDTYGMDSTYDLASSWIGVSLNAGTFNGHTYTAGGQFQSYNKSASAPTSWDSAYTIGIVNALVVGYKLSGDSDLLVKAKHVWQRHQTAKGACYSGFPWITSGTGFTLPHHFSDTIANNCTVATPNVYTQTFFDFDKGEWQRSWLLYENGGSPSLVTDGPVAHTGLDWNGTTLGTGPNYTNGQRRGLFWAEADLDLPLPYPFTAMFKKLSRSQPAANDRFSADWFRGNGATFQWGSNYCNSYYGWTEYPSPARTNESKTEVSAGQNFGSCTDKVTRDDGSSPYTTYGVWHSRAITARDAGAVYEHKGYYDLIGCGVGTACTVTSERNADWNTGLPDDSIFMGQTGQTLLTGQSWGGEARWEESNGIFRGLQFYTVTLTTVQLQALGACDTNACVLAYCAANGLTSSLWYLNMNPTPTDVNDKSGNGHHPTWRGSARPTLYTGALMPANDDLFEEAAYAMAA